MSNEWSDSILKAGIKKRELDKNLSFAHLVENEFTLERYNQIYDLCCGKGILGRYLSRIGYNVVGIDHHYSSKLGRLMLPIPPKYLFYRENHSSCKFRDNSSYILFQRELEFYPEVF